MHSNKNLIKVIQEEYPFFFSSIPLLEKKLKLEVEVDNQKNKIPKEIKNVE